MENPQPTKKGLVGIGGDLVQELDGEVGDQVVAGALAVAVEDENFGRSGRRASSVGSGREQPSGMGIWTRGMSILAPRAVGCMGLDVAVEVGPGVGVVEAGVEELAAAQRGVAVLPEEVREGDPLGMRLDDGGGVAEDSVSRGSGR